MHTQNSRHKGDRSGRRSRPGRQAGGDSAQRSFNPGPAGFGDSGYGRMGEDSGFSEDDGSGGFWYHPDRGMSGAPGDRGRGGEGSFSPNRRTTSHGQLHAQPHGAPYGQGHSRGEWHGELGHGSSNFGYGEHNSGYAERNPGRGERPSTLQPGISLSHIVDRSPRERVQEDRWHGRFLGKGPKGYIRSNERIYEEVCELLSEGFLDASDIEVQVRDGIVTLTGTVLDRRSKILAEEIVESAQGVKDVENRLRLGGTENKGTGERSPDSKAKAPDTAHAGKEPGAVTGKRATA